jgi:hypothetical protein
MNERDSSTTTLVARLREQEDSARRLQMTTHDPDMTLVEQVARRMATFRGQNPDTECLANVKDLGEPPEWLEAKPHSGGSIMWIRWRSYVPEATKLIRIVREHEK